MLPNPCDGCSRNLPSTGCVCPAWKYYFRVNWAEVCRPFRQLLKQKNAEHNMQNKKERGV